MNQDLAVMFVLITLAISVAFVLYSFIVNLRRARESKNIADIHARLLDRFQSGADLTAYLESESVKRFLSSATAAEEPRPYGRILTSLQLGIVLALVGASLLTLRLGAVEQQHSDALLYLGTPVLALGIGFILAGALSYKLSQNWGLFNRPEDGPRL